MIRRGIRPRFKIGFDRPDGKDSLRRVLPIRRSWVAIAILAIMDLIFIIPAVSTFQQATGEWSKIDSLFDLVGIVTQYDVSKMRNLRIEHPAGKSGRSWRGPHFVFDYGANAVAFGSSIDSGQLAALTSRIQIVTGTAIRRGDALPGEVQTKWEPDAEKSPDLPLAEPYSRIIFMHLVLIFGGGLTLILGELIPVLLMVIGLKIYFDVQAHLKQRLDR